MSQPTEPRIRKAVILYGAEEEKILRRLGAALVVQWPVLPDSLKDLLKAQAATVFDREPLKDEGRAIEQFLSRYSCFADQD